MTAVKLFGSPVSAYACLIAVDMMLSDGRALRITYIMAAYAEIFVSQAGIRVTAIFTAA